MCLNLYNSELLGASDYQLASCRAYFYSIRRFGFSRESLWWLGSLAFYVAVNSQRTFMISPSNFLFIF